MKFRNFLLIISSCFVALLVVEFIYRGYVHFHKPIHRPSSFPSLGWELTPGAKLSEVNIEGIPVTYSVNLSGFRDETNGLWNRWKKDDIKIAFIGDSITYGEGVENKNTFVSVVESALSGGGGFR